MNGLLEIASAEAVAENAAATCSLDNYLAQPDHTMDARIAAARATLGTDVVLLGHHYQRDEVIRFADFTGDSYKLSKVASETNAKYMLFCGVHFMAETADVLGQSWQQVILPDLNAGCSMADMAEIGQVEDCWDSLERVGLMDANAGGLIPLTYMNSAAAIKAFCGRHGGLVCTSSNARKAFEWAFARAGKILFLPDQHLGRNTAFAMGIPMSEMVVWDPYQINGGLSPDRLKAAKVILWKGHCSVHQRFLPEHVDRVRREHPEMQVIVHPECRWEVCQKADAIGSTERIIDVIEKAPEGSSFAVGTEIHLVNRLTKRFAPLGKRVMTLDDAGCLCTTMYRISPQHLAWALENLVEGRVVNRIKVEDDVKQWARVALDRMLEIEDLSKIFTLSEAQTLLPVVEALLRKAQAAGVLAGELEGEMQQLSTRIFLSGGMHVDVSAAARRRAERDKAVQEAKDTLVEIDAIGVLVKDLEQGLLDFPSMMDGKPVLLCWKLGEPAIAHWHTEQEGFAGRKPLDSRFGKTERFN